MKRIKTVIIGAGQAGLAMSRCLSDRSIAHVVIERGEVANSWRTERWHSLRLLTPNWQSRLPGYRYTGADPDGYMSMPEIAEYLSHYARTFDAPVETGTTVLSVTGDGSGYRVKTDRGDWICENVVLASGACNVSSVPAFASGIPSHIRQTTPLAYRNHGQLKDGGVLIVGASATGVQLAAEIRSAGFDVMLAAGEHIRMPRRYRGRDIQWWMEEAGIHASTADEIDDLERARRVPSLQLVGSHQFELLDINTLQRLGVEVTGRLAGIRDRNALFSGSLANNCRLSDLKMNRLLDTLDSWAETRCLDELPSPHRFAPTEIPDLPRLSQNLFDGRIQNIIWATGFRPDYSWLHLPVFDAKGRLRHDRGLIAPGLYVLGLPFMRRRNSALIDGVGKDALELAGHIERHSRREAA